MSIAGRHVFTFTGGYRAFLLYSTPYEASGLATMWLKLQFRVTDCDGDEARFSSIKFYLWRSVSSFQVDPRTRIGNCDTWQFNSSRFREVSLHPAYACMHSIRYCKYIYTIN